MNTNVYENTDSETITPLNKRRILPVFLLVGLYAASTAAVMSVLPFYIREMGGSPLIIGIIIATEAFSQFCAAPLIGHLSDRVGRKRILIVTLAIAAISLLLLANAQCILFILLARTLFGISAGNLSAAAAYIADCTHVRNRRQAIGILTGCIGLGGIVGAGVSGWLSRISLSAPIYAAFILVLGSALVAIWGLKDPSTTSRTTDKIAAFSARAILKMPVLRVLIIVMLCHFFAYGMYSSQLPVFLSDTFIWNGLPFGPKALSYLLMADGVINIFVQLFLLGWVSQYFSERKLIILIFALLCTGFLTAGIATTIPVLVFAIVCISIADALAKPTYLAALSVHVSPARQGIVIGTAQALIAIADFINASGDDFFVPDNTRFYYSKLPGVKSLRIVPNMNHYSINQFAEESLVPFINRFQSKKTLPQLIGLIHHHLLTVYFSEAPVKVVRWTANNPNARDFRYACGIRYKPLTIDIPANNKISITLNEPKTGWEATYIEATFNDGYVATSQVYITPDEKYPQTAPPSVNAACQTLPGRGLGENDSPD
ncbi:MFS transporter [Salmonella enterica subsp. enterica]|nr:MFS transporter [Salmonella enterica subsp. enterica serovar Enteritidis]